MLFDILIILLIACLVMAVWCKDLLPSAIFLAGSSIVASIIFYMFGAMWVAVFELTVVAGLITVLFVSAISLTRDLSEQIEHNRITTVLPISLAVLFVVVCIVATALADGMPDKILSNIHEHDDFRKVMWSERKFDILGQMAVITAGVFGIAAFFRHEPKRPSTDLEHLLETQADQIHHQDK